MCSPLQCINQKRIEAPPEAPSLCTVLGGWAAMWKVGLPCVQAMANLTRLHVKLKVLRHVDRPVQCLPTVLRVLPPAFAAAEAQVTSALAIAGVLNM